ncbi:hypothetical protein HIO71_06425 [Chryseobacterium aquaticum]|uniref:DUF6705 domain-containing protein n=1 Tax=Chryseobacterium aquaticum TaxID=452084 RepID=A0A848N2T9_9FLAO|nr:MULTISPECIES: DUF6705 family protein [Chryseobacterium]NMR33844.1 hypothetical protein [Chryseobacterium aquaticum]NRQ45920.1 hypothetical protein [Chryseobacterium sp. C-204]
MKKLFFLLSIHLMVLSCAQTYPLNTYTAVPSNSYIKDINNELVPYEGIWKGTWNSKTIYIYFKRIKKLQDHLNNNPYYKDVLVGRFKIVDSNGLILFDDSQLPDNETKIEGIRFFTIPNKRYSLLYMDSDPCGITGDIYINFIDSTQTKLNWKFIDTTEFLPGTCLNPYTQILPSEILLLKQ